MKKQVALIILDGWGYREDKEDNAIAVAKTDFFDSLWNKYPHSLLMASEEYVGLPKGQVGNSEIGHMTIGAGQVIDTDLVRISKDIKCRDFHENENFKKVLSHVVENNSTLHIMGLVGDGGVHAHQEHFLAFLDLCKEQKIEKVALHLFTDGRDCGPADSIPMIEQIDNQTDNNIFISTISGRYYSMDRDNNWDRLDKFFKLLDKDDSTAKITNYKEEIKRQYLDGKGDEHIEPFILEKSEIKDSDGIVIINFRADRVRMLTSKLLEQKSEKNLEIVTMTEYREDFDCRVAFPSKKIETVLANEISKVGMTQAHLAETEKFPHATYFLNGGKEDPHEGEEHIVLDSRKDVATHDMAPEMRAEDIATEAISRIKSDVNFIFINFANPDMVGHTANVEAIITAIEFVDIQLKRVVNALEENGGVAIITADHGNAEVNIDSETKDKHTSHTINPVPCIITKEGVSLKDGSLKDLAPTTLELLGIKKPESMTGECLIS